MCANTIDGDNTVQPPVPEGKHQCRVPGFHPPPIRWPCLQGDVNFKTSCLLADRQLMINEWLLKLSITSGQLPSAPLFQPPDPLCLAYHKHVREVACGRCRGSNKLRTRLHFSGMPITCYLYPVECQLRTSSVC